MTVRVPDFQLAATTHTGLVSLKVADLEKMTQFYTEVIGLKVLSEKEGERFFGTEDGVTLLILKKVDQPLPITRKTGARGLRSILEEVLNPLMFDLPSLNGKTITIKDSDIQKKQGGNK